MSRIDVPFVVEKQRIIQPTREKIASGGRNYIYATFTVNDTWEDVENLKAVFKRDTVEKLISLTETETGYECKIPWEVMATTGSFLVGIFGGDRLLTDYAYVIVKQGCVTDGESPLPPTPDWFTKIEKELENIDDVGEKVGILESDINAAKEGVDILSQDVSGIRQQINQHAHFKGYFSTDAKIQSTEATPNDFAYSAESGTKWVYDEVDGWQDSGTPVPDQLTPASDITPLVNGEASVGTENAYARGDHRHPTDTSRASAAEVKALKKDFEDGRTHIYENGDVDILDQEIENKSVHYYGVVSNKVNVMFPVDEPSFLSALYFSTPAVVPDDYSVFPENAKFKGDSVEDERFIPEANMRYTIGFDFDGRNFIGYVSGVSLE